jgi:hypothetical protein
MGFRIEGPPTIAFLEWVHQQYPDEQSFQEMSEAVRHRLLHSFCSRLPPGMRPSETELQDLVHNGFLRSDAEGYSVVDRRSLLGRWIGKSTLYDALARYKSATAKGVFLYTAQDTDFRDYLKGFWRALDEESGSVLHFFDYGLEQPKRRRPYRFAEDYIRALAPIPGADLQRIRATGLPCFLVWTDLGDTAVVPFADVQGDHSATRERFRAVLQHLAVADVASLRTLFEPVVRTALSQETDVFVSYQHYDRPWVESLCSAIEATGRRVWFDGDLRAGERWDIRIRHMLSRAKAVLVVWSERSIRSEFVLSEAEYARIKKTLIPLFKEANVVPPVPFNAIHALNLSTWSPDGPLPPDLARELSGLI